MWHHEMWQTGTHVSKAATFIFLAHKHLTTRTAISYRSDMTQKVHFYTDDNKYVRLYNNMKLLEWVNNYQPFMKFLYHGAYYMNGLHHRQ